jgi:LPXTG-motif cell wall-anchored protein
MKAALFVFSMSVLLLATASAADLAAINGTWSGNWTPKGGVPDAVTVELRRDAAGNLTGKFLTPAPMDFSKASFNRTTGTVTCEAKDEKSGKQSQLQNETVAATTPQGTEVSLSGVHPPATVQAPGEPSQSITQSSPSSTPIATVASNTPLKTLPKTSSNMPLFALTGIMLLGAALSLRILLD